MNDNMKNQPCEGGENEAREVIQSLLDFVLNRHVHKLAEHGYLIKEKYDKEYGYDGDAPKRALQLKKELIREAQLKFAKPLSKKFK